MPEFIHRLSYFDHAFDNRPKCVGLTWSRFCETLLPHKFRPNVSGPCPACGGSGCGPCKKSGEVPAKWLCPAFSPAFYPDHATRSKHQAECASLWMADLDELTDEQLEQFVELALSRDWAFMMLSTWSHGSAAKTGNCMRAVFPLAREVSPTEWQPLWQAINNALGALGDPKCKDISRLYFGAYAPEGAEHLVFSNVWEGEPIDVDALLVDMPKPPPTVPNQTKPTAKEKVSRARLERFAKQLKRKHDDRKSELGELLLKVTQGESFASKGNRDNMIFRLSKELARHFTECDPLSLAKHFAPSLSLMAQEAEECPTVDDVAYKIERAQEELIAEQAAEEAAYHERLARRIRDAFGTDRAEPYKPSEVPDNVRWIVQKGSSFYAWVAGEYRGPYLKDEAHNAILRDLSPATSVGVELYTTSPTGITVPKSIAQLVRQYGFVANDVAVSLTADHSHFDESTRTLVEARCKLRELEPAHNAGVEAWLKALAGPEREHLLLAWIANVTRLEVPCTALFLTGPKNTGKSLGPLGLAKLWTKHGSPTPLQDVLGTNFNETQLWCPLTWADEKLPTDYRGRVLHDELREFIQSRMRPLRRKFQPSANMIGSTRLIISANNEEVLASQGEMSNHDIDASIDRFLWIPCMLEAAEVLKSIDHSDWVESDIIARHALWLRENFTWKPNGRFLVHSDDRELHSRLSTTSGVRSSVMQFCVGFLLDPNPGIANAKAQFLIRVWDGKLYANAQGVVAAWESYVKNEKCPTTGRIAGALAALSDRRARLTIPNSEKRPNYREIKTEHLVAWAERAQYATEEEITDALKINTEDRAAHLREVKTG